MRIIEDAVLFAVKELLGMLRAGESITLQNGHTIKNHHILSILDNLREHNQESEEKPQG